MPEFHNAAHLRVTNSCLAAGRRPRRRVSPSTSLAPLETSHSVVCQYCGTENMPLEYLCLQCGKMLPTEMVDADGLAQQFRDSAIPPEDQEIPEIRNTSTDFDLRAADQGAMTMADVIKDLAEPRRPLLVDKEVPLTHPDSKLDLGKMIHCSKGFVSAWHHKNKFTHATRHQPRGVARGENIEPTRDMVVDL